MRNLEFLKNSQRVQRRDPTGARTWIFLDNLKHAFRTSLFSQILHLLMYECCTTHNHYFHQVSPFIFKFLRLCQLRVWNLSSLGLKDMKKCSPKKLPYRIQWIWFDCSNKGICVKNFHHRKSTTNSANLSRQVSD